LGNALSSLGQFGQAIKHYERAVEIDPGDIFARNNLGVLLIRQGKADQAVAHWKKILTISPKSIQPRLFLGKALAGQGNFEQAVTQFQKVIEIDSKNIQAINDLAWVLATCPKNSVRDGARAVELAKQACEATGHRIPGLMVTLAAAYAEAGKFSEAIDTATKALGLVQPGQKSAAEQIRRQLEHYKAGKPYRWQP